MGMDDGFSGSLGSSDLFNLDTGEDSDGGTNETALEVETEAGDDDVVSGDEVSTEESTDSNDEVEPKEEDSEETSEDADEPEESEDAATEEETEPKKNEPPARKKPFIVTVDGEKTKLAPNAVVRVTVDGKEEEISLHELATGFSSKRKIDSEYFAFRTEKEEFAKEKTQSVSELETAKQTFVQERDELVNVLVAIQKSEKKVPAFAELLENAGIESFGVLKSIRDELINNARQYLEASEEERKMMDAVEKASYYEWREKRRTEKAAKEREATQARQAKEALLKKFGATEAEYQEAVKALKELNQQVNHQTIESQFEVRRVVDRAESIIKAVSPNLLKDEKMLRNVVQTIRAYNPTDEELKAAIRNVAGVSDTGASSGKPQQKSKTTVIQKPQKSKSGTSNWVNRRDGNLFI